MVRSIVTIAGSASSPLSLQRNSPSLVAYQFPVYPSACSAAIVSDSVAIGSPSTSSTLPRRHAVRGEGASRVPERHVGIEGKDRQRRGRHPAVEVLLDPGT